MYKKVICIALIASMLLAIVLSGCKSTKENVISDQKIEKTGETGDKAEKKKVKLTVWSGWQTPERTKFHEEMYKKFMEMNADIEVEFLGIPGDPKEKVDMAIASGTEPDISDVNEATFSEYIIRGVVLQLDDYFDKWDGKDDIIPSALESMRNYDSKNRKLYAMPDSANVWLMWIRNDWFKEANITPPETWDQFFEAVQKLTDKQKGRYGLGIRGGSGSAINLEYLMYAYSGVTEYFTADGKCTINDPLNVEFADKYLSLYNVYTAESDLNNGWTELAAEFQSGKSAIIAHNLGSADGHEQAFDHDYSKFSAMNYPKSVKGYRVQPALLPGGVYIYKSSKNPDAAWRVLSYLTSKENVSETCKAYGGMPLNKEVFNESWMKERPYMQTGVDLLDSPDTKYYREPVEMPDYYSILTTQIEPMVQKVMAKKMTAKEMCDEWAALMEKAKADFDANIKN